MVEYPSQYSPLADPKSGGGIWRVLSIYNVRCGSAVSNEILWAWQVPSYMTMGLRVMGAAMRPITSSCPATLADFTLGTGVYGSATDAIVTSIATVSLDDADYGGTLATPANYAVDYPSNTNGVEVAAGTFLMLRADAAVASDFDAELLIYVADR